MSKLIALLLHSSNSQSPKTSQRLFRGQKIWQNLRQLRLAASTKSKGIKDEVKKKWNWKNLGDMEKYSFNKKPHRNEMFLMKSRKARSFSIGKESLLYMYFARIRILVLRPRFHIAGYYKYGQNKISINKKTRRLLGPFHLVLNVLTCIFYCTYTCTNVNIMCFW